MSDVAHVPGQRIQLKKGSSLAEVYASAERRGGSVAEPPTANPRQEQGTRTPRELQSVIDEAGVRYEDCGKLSVSLDWWNRNASNSDWQVSDVQPSASG